VKLVANRIPQNHVRHIAPRLVLVPQDLSQIKQFLLFLGPQEAGETSSAPVTPSSLPSV
jgi:hypothetical protein